MRLCLAILIGLGAWASLSCSASPASPPPKTELAPKTSIAGSEAPVVSAEPSLASPVSSSTNSPADAAEPEATKPPESASPPDTRPRIGSLRWVTYIWPTPDRPKGHLPIGALRHGTSIPLRQPDPVPGGGCRSKWYAVEPLGFICADDTTTLNLHSPYWKALSSMAPGPGPRPYQYAFSTGTPMYMRVPTKAEQEDAERNLGPVQTFKPQGKWFRTYERLVNTNPADKIKATGEIPSFFRNHQTVEGGPYHPAAKPRVRFAPPGTALSWAQSFEAEGRVWVITPELLVVPADRLFPFSKSDFKGFALEGNKQLPIAWVRGETAPKLQRKDDGTFVETGQAWIQKTPVFLTGNEVRSRGVLHCETRENGLWIADTEAVSVARAVKSLPRSFGPEEKWIEAYIMDGTMVAYHGLTPVYATLWSGGRGGVPEKGHDPREYATTELGVFAIQWKDKTATMSPDKGAPTTLWFADVPHIQYLHAPLAMHVAFWHGDFGYLRSAECLNVSPLDGEWFFGWTLPTLPTGWGAVRPSKAMGPSTRVLIKP